MRKTTKKLLTLGALSTAIVPIATTISCGKEIVEVVVKDNRKKPKVEPLPEMHFNANPAGAFAEVGDTIDLEYTAYFGGGEILGGKTTKTNVTVGNSSDLPHAALAKRVAELNLELNKEQFASVLVPLDYPIVEYKGQIVYYRLKVTKLVKKSTNSNTVNTKIAEQYDEVLFDVTETKDSDNSLVTSERHFNYKIGSLKEDPNNLKKVYEDAIIGMHQGEEREMHYTYPVNSATGSLSGKSVVFLIVLHTINKAVYFKQSSNITSFNNAPSGSFAETGDTVNLEFTPYFNGTMLPTGKKVISHYVVGHTNANIDEALAKRIKEVHLEVNKEQTIYVLPTGAHSNKLLTYKIKITSITKAASNHNATDSKIASVHDTVVFDFMGFEDASKLAFEGGTAANYRIDSLNNTPPSFINGFETQMIGMHVGETKVVHVIFPANYQKRILRNKHATFVVILHSIVKHP